MKEDLGKYIAIGLILGTAIGVATNNIGLWIAIGLVLGTAVGVSKNNIKKKWFIILNMGVLKYERFHRDCWRGNHG